ncbi:tektin-2 isoform X2 [Dunckerocampus dactyliophorus]|uniref:tektin-2 isoform X2 n=1 Tax=Dunckerocampus dactyliophorus TaxID=161453 RepID=UPI002405FC51|nr:tektin-2 isoform X2 [Dunckerocampus dactyliophorus]
MFIIMKLQSTFLVEQYVDLNAIQVDLLAVMCWGHFSVRHCVVWLPRDGLMPLLWKPPKQHQLAEHSGTSRYYCSGTMSKHPEKPSVHYSVPEWCNNNNQLSATAQIEQQLSNVIRQESRSLRNDTNCKTLWDESDTSSRLSDRVWEVARWKELLVSCAHKVDEEMEALTLSKTRTEETLAATTVPLEVSLESLTLREGRPGLELVNDPVEEQLKNEVHVIERVQQVLQQHIDEAFEQLCILQKIRQQLTADLQNKMETLDIDTSCLALTITSSQISLKPNPTRIPAGSCTPHEWVKFSQLNLARAQEAMRMSQQMRDDMSLSRVNMQNDLKKQQRATEFALRKRNHQEQQASSELQWQLKNTEDEIAEMESDIFRLDADLQAKMAPLKLAHTRLENRTYRPGMDLCRDEAQRTLVEEVNQLQATIATLKKKLSEAQHSLQRLKLHHNKLLQDLARKKEALALEQRCINVRSRLIPILHGDDTPVPLVLLTNSSGRSTQHLKAQ